MSSSVQSSELAGGPDPDAGSVDPAAKPVRRSFTAEYRARVVAEYGAAPRGEKAGAWRPTTAQAFAADTPEHTAAAAAYRTRHPHIRTSHNPVVLVTIPTLPATAPASPAGG